MGVKVVHTGFIPYYFNNIDGKYYLFISEEIRDKGKWCGFSGGKQNGESIVNGAAREGWEESMGLFGNLSSIKNKILKADYAIFSKNGNKASVQYLIEANRDQFNNLEANYNNVCEYLINCNSEGYCQPKDGCYEKKRGKWLAIDFLLYSAINNKSLGRGIGRLRELFDKSLAEGHIIKNPKEKMFNYFL